MNTVFVECGAGYSHRDPDPMAPVGETCFVAAAAADLLDRCPGRAPIAGIVATADLRSESFDDMLDAHIDAGVRLFLGIRHALSAPIAPEELTIAGGPRR